MRCRFNPSLNFRADKTTCLMKKITFFRTAVWCLSICFATTAFAQNVGINDDNSTPDPNAMLDVKSTSKGVLFPRLTTAQRTALGAANPTDGMLVFDSDVDAYFYFANGDWVQLSTGAGSGVPVGTILAYGDDTPPEGYLACNGNSVKNTDFPALYAVIGTNWGGDGTPYFTLPDLRGRFLRGWNNGAGVDPDAESRKDTNGNPAGDVVGSYQEDAFQDHTHAYTKNQTTIDRGSSGGQAAVLRNTVLAATTGANNNPSSETRPKNASVHYIIKY